MPIANNRIEATSRLPRQSPRLAPRSILVPVLVLGLATVISGCATHGNFTPGASTPTAGQAAPGATSPAPTTSITPSRSVPLSIAITSPSGVVDCKDPAPQCQFQATLQVTGTLARSQEIVVLVYPLNPPGGGWFIQSPSPVLEASGTWLQDSADIGSSTAPAHDGDTLLVEALVIRVGATYNGTSLEDISKAAASIQDPRQITGLVYQSTPVQMKVKRP
jgi:hypothetical protein